MDKTQFVTAISEYIDPDGMIGSCPNPTKWSSGNGLMETSIACVMETILNGNGSDIAFLKARQLAMMACKNPDWTWNKNPGRSDEITHDDLMSIASTQRVCGFSFAACIVKLGLSKGWMLGNTDTVYWDACVKPWQKAFYLMAAGRVPAWYEVITLFFSIIIDTKSGDPSTNRLTWLMRESLKGFSPFIDMAFSFWSSGMKKKYGNVGNMMLQYYGNPAHPYVEFGQFILF